MCATRARARTPKYIDRVYALRCLGEGGGVFLVWGERRGHGGRWDLEMLGFLLRTLANKKKPTAHPKITTNLG